VPLQQLNEVGAGHRRTTIGLGAELVSEITDELPTATVDQPELLAIIRDLGYSTVFRRHRCGNLERRQVVPVATAARAHRLRNTGSHAASAARR